MTRRRTRILGIVAAGALALTACASQDPDTPDDPGTDGTTEGTDETAASGGTVRVAETNAFTSFNPSVGANNLDINSKVLGTMRSDFIYLDNDLNIVQDESFGTYEVLSEEPLQVQYTINDDVVWSDGNAIDKGDMLLAWAAQSGYFDDGETILFQWAGSTEGLALTSMPEFDGERTMTLNYDEPYV